MYTLAIESSCDETAAAIVKDGRVILADVIASQVAVHSPYGGVVPELASRRHVEAILPVISQALQEARLTWEEIDAVAVTQGPGLVGALLVGMAAAKAIAYALDKPLIAVSHLEGHMHAPADRCWWSRWSRTRGRWASSMRRRTRPSASSRTTWT